ncbi:hypothetical protein ACFE04_028598 [Oxalis oulophora]
MEIVLIDETYRTLVRAIPEFTVSSHGFSFTPLHEMKLDFYLELVLKREYDMDGKRTRMNVIELTSNGINIECTLFGNNYVNQLNTFLASGVTSSVVIIQFVIVKSFRGQVVLQNVMYATNLFFDAILRKLRISRKEIVCVTLATIVHVDEGEKWWYTACNKCNKSVLPKSGMYHCDSCNIFVSSVSLGYRLKVVVEDEFDCASFVIFDRDAFFLFGKTSADMLDEVHKGDDLHDLHTECEQLIDKLFLFKVDVKYSPSSKMEPSYRVIRLSNDPSLIQKFKETTSDYVVDCTPLSGRHAESIHLGADEDSAIDKESITKVPSISKKRSNEWNHLLVMSQKRRTKVSDNMQRSKRRKLRSPS